MAIVVEELRQVASQIKPLHSTAIWMLTIKEGFGYLH